MKQKVLDALKAKFVGVSDSILSRIADKVAKTVTNEEDVTTAVEGVTFQQVLESYGDSRATSASATAIHNYENKYGLKDGAKVTPAVEPTKPNDGAGDVPSWAQALIDSNTQLNARLNAMDVERTTNARRQQLDNVIGKLPESFRKAYERTPIENLSDEEFSTLVGEITTEVEGIVNDKNTKGAIFGRPTAQGSQIQQGELTKEQQEVIAHRDSVVADGEQPF